MLYKKVCLIWLINRTDFTAVEGTAETCQHGPYKDLMMLVIDTVPNVFKPLRVRNTELTFFLLMGLRKQEN